MKYTNKELIDILIKYNEEFGLPTQRKFKSKNGLPSYSLYINRFGSFKNAILEAGIVIPEEKSRFFNRVTLSDKELLELLKTQTDKKLLDDIFLMTIEDINKNKNMPCGDIYNHRFKNIANAYNLIGYNYFEYNDNALKNDIVKKYKLLAEKLGKTPNSRDVTQYSKNGECYCATSCINHFGSLYKLQLICNLHPTRVGSKLSDEECLDCLLRLSETLTRVPTAYDIIEDKYSPGLSEYTRRFGGLEKALLLIGLNSNKKTYTTNKGTKCLSYIEYKFAKMLENNNIKFSKENYYNEFVDTNKKYRFDFITYADNNRYFVEIFGINGNNKYDNTTNDKIKICMENNLKLITFKFDDFWGTTNDELLKIYKNKIKNTKN